MLLDLLTLEQPRGSLRPRRIGWELFDDEVRYKLLSPSGASYTFVLALVAAGGPRFDCGLLCSVVTRRIIRDFDARGKNARKWRRKGARLPIAATARRTVF